MRRALGGPLGPDVSPVGLCDPRRPVGGSVALSAVALTWARSYCTQQPTTRCGESFLPVLGSVCEQGLSRGRLCYLSVWCNRKQGMGVDDGILNLTTCSCSLTFFLCMLSSFPLPTPRHAISIPPIGPPHTGIQSHQLCSQIASIRSILYPLDRSVMSPLWVWPRPSDGRPKSLAGWIVSSECKGDLKAHRSDSPRPIRHGREHRIIEDTA